MSIIRITSQQDGYRRAGTAHSVKAVEHPPGTFTAEQLAQLQADPRLSVQVIDSPHNPESAAVPALAAPGSTGGPQEAVSEAVSQAIENPSEDRGAAPPAGEPGAGRTKGRKAG